MDNTNKLIVNLANLYGPQPSSSMTRAPACTGLSEETIQVRKHLTKEEREDKEKRSQALALSFC